jgi:hypothetical protein
MYKKRRGSIAISPTIPCFYISSKNTFAINESYLSFMAVSKEGTIFLLVNNLSTFTF